MSESSYSNFGFAYLSQKWTACKILHGSSTVSDNCWIYLRFCWPESQNQPLTELQAELTDVFFSVLRTFFWL